MRPKKSGKDLPPRMLRRTKKLVSGKVWTSYYYNGRDESGKRIEIPLGSDINEAKRKWAEFERKPAPSDTSLMRFIFDRYAREVVPTKALRTQKDNEAELRMLRKVFDTAPIDAITPQHIAQYRDARPAKTRANRELALLSHCWNMAREWGYTSRENPCAGVRKNREIPRDFYADDSVWNSVYEQAVPELRDAMDLAYLTGQRPGDVLRMCFSDVRDGTIEVQQAKTTKRLRIELEREDGSPTMLGTVIERIKGRKVRSLHLVATPQGKPLNKGTLTLRFVAARKAASALALEQGDTALAERILQFQFRDARPKAASEIQDLAAASALLGHSDKQITKTVYRRVGERVKPTR